MTNYLVSQECSSHIIIKDNLSTISLLSLAIYNSLGNLSETYLGRSENSTFSRNRSSRDLSQAYLLEILMSNYLVAQECSSHINIKDDQITSFKETIAKVLDKDTSLAEKIRTLFREQGITIASILMAIGMANGVLVAALVPGGEGEGGGNPLPKDEKGLKKWIRNKLKALASLLGRLGMKAAGKSAEALPGIIRAVISWILNRAGDVVGWVSQNLWVLFVGITGLLYMYMVIKK